MFEIHSHKVIIKDLHKIASNYLSLFNDGDHDIVYSGNNIYGNRILGVIMFEDDENNFLRFIHVLLTDRQYIDFLNRKITLRSILELIDSFFLVDKKYNDEEISANLATLEDVPEQFRPLNNSYCPNYIIQSSFNYGISLKGNLADSHLAEPNVLNEVNSHISSFIQSATEFVKDLSLTRNIYVEALQAGSFKINFKIEIEHHLTYALFQVSINEIKDFVNSYFNYVLEKLPTESDNAFKLTDIEKSNYFIELENSFNALYSSVGALPKAGIEQKLIDSMSYAIQHLKDLPFGKSFNKLEFNNYNENGSELSIGLIDETYISSVEDKFFKIETEEDIIEIDITPQSYSIQVYSLNKETGKGSAYLSINNGIHKISLHLIGKDNYQNTIFTRNMDEKERKLMEIKGIGKSVNGIVKLVTYTFDN